MEIHLKFNGDFYNHDKKYKNESVCNIMLWVFLIWIWIQGYYSQTKVESVKIQGRI
jgi:hypothetical protein